MPDIFTNEQQKNSSQNSGIEKNQSGPFRSSINRSREVGLLSSFVRDPKGIAIAEQNVDEKILLFIRRNTIITLPWITLGITLSLAPIVLPFFFSPVDFLSKFLPITTIILLTFFYYLIVFGFMFANFVTWFYDIGIVTEERSVDIDFYNISYVSVATAKAQDLKDVRYYQRGIFESLFDYGDVTMAVESSNETLTFDKAPHPAEIVTIVSGIIGGHQGRGN